MIAKLITKYLLSDMRLSVDAGNTLTRLVYVELRNNLASMVLYVEDGLVSPEFNSTLFTSKRLTSKFSRTTCAILRKYIRTEVHSKIERDLRKVKNFDIRLLAASCKEPVFSRVSTKKQVELVPSSSYA